MRRWRTVPDFGSLASRLRSVLMSPLLKNLIKKFWVDNLRCRRRKESIQRLRKTVKKKHDNDCMRIWQISLRRNLRPCMSLMSVMFWNRTLNFAVSRASRLVP